VKVIITDIISYHLPSLLLLCLNNSEWVRGTSCSEKCDIEYHKVKGSCNLPHQFRGGKHYGRGNCAAAAAAAVVVCPFMSFPHPLLHTNENFL